MQYEMHCFDDDYHPIVRGYQTAVLCLNTPVVCRGQVCELVFDTHPSVPVLVTGWDEVALYNLHQPDLAALCYPNFSKLFRDTALRHGLELGEGRFYLVSFLLGARS